MKKINFILLMVIALFLANVTNVKAAIPMAQTIETVSSTASVSEETNQPTAKAEKKEVKKSNKKSFGGKSQIVALLLCLFVGVLGIHRFYLGYMWQGVVQLLTLGGFGIWVLIDLIRIITGSLGPKDGSYDTTL